MTDRESEEFSDYVDMETVSEAVEAFGKKEYRSFTMNALRQLKSDLGFLWVDNVDWSEAEVWEKLHRCLGASSVMGAWRLSALLSKTENRRKSGGYNPTPDEVRAIRDLFSRTEAVYRQLLSSDNL